MQKLLISCLFSICFISIAVHTNAQSSIGDELTDVNTVTTAVPFLRIVPDAQSGGMGDVGIATTPNANAVFQNPSKLAFIDIETGKGLDKAKYGVSLTYTPWLRSLVNDIYLATLNGYYLLDDRQAIGASIRYFSLGEITYRDASGGFQGTGKPNEFALDGHYSRKLGDRFSVGASLRFIYSNLASGQVVAGEEVKPGKAGSGDISLYNTNPISIGESIESNLNFGLAITNIGSKITYNNSAVKDFIPTNLGLGLGWELDLDEHNEINIYADINKLLVPSPDTTGCADGVCDFREKSTVSGMFGSFGDAPGGGKEELREFMYSFGAEYWYNKQFAVRFGYFYEHQSKGARQFLTAGLGVKYSVFGLDFSYLIPTSKVRNPLDNTLRFTLAFNFAQGSGTAASE